MHLRNESASMYPEKPHHATGRRSRRSPAGASAFRGSFRKSCLFELRVPLDKLFRAASGEAHGYTAVFVVALDANDGSNAEARMTNFAPQHGIGFAAALCGGAPEGTFSRRAGRGRLLLLPAPRRPAQKIFPRKRKFPVRARQAWVPHSTPYYAPPV